MNTPYSIFVKHEKTRVIYNVNDNITLNTLKYMIAKKLELPAHVFYIVHASTILDTLDRIRSNPTIEEFNDTREHKISKDSTIYVNIHGYTNIYKQISYLLYDNNYRLTRLDIEDITTEKKCQLSMDR